MRVAGARSWRALEQPFGRTNEACWRGWSARHVITVSQNRPFQRLQVQSGRQRTINPGGTRDFTSKTSSGSTIYALSTAPGRAAIAIIRVSGPACIPIYRALCPAKPDPKPRYATLRTLYLPHQTPTPSSILDPHALVLYFPAPQTATGEDVLELHVHGGPAVVKAVLAAIPATSTTTATAAHQIRYADPGEFTLRAFHNARLTLPQVEALSDTLAAQTEQQRRLSVRGTASSALAQRYESWRNLLLAARGELEALIDFAEDADFESQAGELCASVSAQARALRGLVRVHEGNAVRGELLRGGLGVALLGAPNAGKSSLLNGVVGREAAIVSREAGTTRDVVEVGVDLGGFFCRWGDTAGLRQDGGGNGVGGGVGLVEREGMRRARKRARESDVVVVVASFESGEEGVRLNLDPEVLATAAELVQSKDNVLVALNKADLLPFGIHYAPALETATQQVLAALPGLVPDRIFPLSCKETTSPDGHTNTTATTNTIQPFLQGLISHFHALTTPLPSPSTPSAPEFPGFPTDDSTSHDALGASERHRVLLTQCLEHLDAFLAEVGGEGSAAPVTEAEAVQVEPDVVIAAEHLRGAAECLAQITGRGAQGDVEEVLGVVFEKFCVGK